MIDPKIVDDSTPITGTELALSIQRREVEMRRKKASTDAEARFKLWTSMGVPTMKPAMSEDEYKHTYGGRLVLNLYAFKHESLEEIQTIKKHIFCPACKEDLPERGMMRVSMMCAQIEDDPMTTFPALAHFTCHGCGFDEYHPMPADPRKSMRAGADFMEKIRAEFLAQQEERKYMSKSGLMSKSVDPPPPVGLGYGGALASALPSEKQAAYKYLNKIMSSRGL